MDASSSWSSSRRGCPRLSSATSWDCPRAEIPTFTRHVYDATRYLSLSDQPEDIQVAEAATRQLLNYARAMLDDRRRQPREDFLSRFLAAADEAGELSPLEMLYQIVQLIIGGTDTTRVAIVMQVALLLQHREQWNAVCLDPELIPAAVAESLRYEPSVAVSGEPRPQRSSVRRRRDPGRDADRLFDHVRHARRTGLCRP